MSNYFYHFLEPISAELARTLKELEGAIYNSPRSMLTHSRTLIEAVMEKVMVHENMPNEPYLTIIERIQDLDENGLLTEEVKMLCTKSGNAETLLHTTCVNLGILNRLPFGNTFMSSSNGLSKCMALIRLKFPSMSILK